MKKVSVIVVCFLLVVSMLMVAACAPAAPAASEAPAAAASEAPAAAASEAPASAAPAAADEPAAAAPADGSSGGPYVIPTIVKLIGIGWFDRMAEGTTEFAETTGNQTSLLGPPQADAALQNQIIEDQIAQSVDAISIVPFSPEACEPVLKKAMDKGIVVIAHEADNLNNCDYDLEAFDNNAYGAELMKILAEKMGGEGKYVTTVGSVTSKSQNQWEEGGVTEQETNFPKMELVERKLETQDQQKNAQDIMVQMLKKYPDLKGFQGATSQDAPGAAQAVEDAGLIGKVFVVGTTMPSISAKYMENGSLAAMGLWDPKLAGMAMDEMAVMILDGKRDQIKPGVSLGIKGYEDLQMNENASGEDMSKYYVGNAMIMITTPEEMAEYNF